MKLALTCALVLGACGATALAQRANVVLPTEWSLSPPPGRVVATGTLPQGAALTADGAHLVVVEDGQSNGDVRIYDPATLALERTVVPVGAFGAPLPDATGNGFFVSLGEADALAHVDAASGAIDRTIQLPQPFWAADIARSPDGTLLAASGDLAHEIAFVGATSGAVVGRVAVGRHPSGLAFSADGSTLYVANRAESSVSVVDVASRTLRASIAVGKHPTALRLARDGKTLYVAESDDDAVGAIDVATQRRVADIDVAPYAAHVYGASPSALTLSPDGTRLYVSDSAANAIAVLRLDGPAPVLAGTIATGWYPTAVVVARDGATLDVFDGKGESSRPNPQFAPFSGAHSEHGYVAADMIGSIRQMPVPNDADLARGLATVRANVAPGRAAGARSIVRANGPIRHVIYVVKENRTYDQVLGDLKGGDGDAALTLFGATVTPNEHAIATRFGILDRTYADAEVSADGHNWTMGAFANDYLERMWPPSYGGRRSAYDFEDGAEASVPHAGFLWDDALAHHVSVRNYGEFTTELSLAPMRVVSHVPSLAPVTDPRFPGFDLGYSDLDREAEWAREYAAYVATDSLPQLEIVRLPNDHTSGTAPRKLSPRAYVSQNDRAVGLMIDAVSHSRYWKDTVVFVVEDDAQNGADHVDAQRMTAYVASAYARGGVVHAHHSTAGIDRTIETFLGLPPMSAYDASARLLDDAFGDAPTQRPYDALAETVDPTEKNAANAYGARQSATMDFTHEDRAPANALNAILERAARTGR